MGTGSLVVVEQRGAANYLLIAVARGADHRKAEVWSSNAWDDHWEAQKSRGELV